MKGRDKRRRAKSRRQKSEDGSQKTVGRKEAQEAQGVNIYPLVDDINRPYLRFGQKEAASEP